MELKIKYQYTYFIKPFLIEKDKYEKYLGELLNNKDYSLKFFEKERDLNLYSYFMENVREYFFPTFSFNSEKINEFKKMSTKEKLKIVLNFHCNIFEYKLKERPQGKIDTQDGIFFDIDKIQIICFDSGICFLVIKTNIENSKNFSDLLNFNYKFKDITSEYNKLKEYNAIKIQTEAFENISDFSEFINNITGINTDIDLYNKRLFVYTYSCIDQENWNSEEDFENIENEFIKYINVLSSNNTLDFNAKDFQKNYDEYKMFKYAKFGFTKQSASLMTSSIDINNYTKILFDYENEYLYTLIFRLYQRIYLKKMEKELKDKKNLTNTINMFYKFTKEIWFAEITNSVTGTMYYNKWKQIFELDEIYEEIKNKYEIIYKQFNIDNNIKSNKTIFIAFAVSLILNVVNFIAILKLL